MKLLYNITLYFIWLGLSMAIILSIATQSWYYLLVFTITFTVGTAFENRIENAVDKWLKR